MKHITEPDFSLPPEIYTPYTTPGYKPAYEGHVARDLNIVVEGGALRGIFAAGALDFLMDMGVWAQNLIGVSAGVLCGYNYVSGERGRTAYVNTRWCPDSRYLSIQSAIKTGNAYGVDFAFRQIPERLCPADKEGFSNSISRLIAVVTCLETGEAEYMPVRGYDRDWPIMRASSAMPFVSKPTEIDGRHYLDGGIADSIPFEYSLSLGNAKHIVLLTQERGFEKEPNRMMGLGKVAYRKYPRFAEAMQTRTSAYNRKLAEIDRLDESGEVFALYPPHHPNVAHMEPDRVKVFSLYLEGYLEAQRRWPALQEYLES